MIEKFKNLLIKKLKERAYAHFNRREFTQAEIACNNVIHIDKTDFECKVLLAHIYVETLNPYRAVGQFEVALAAAPDAFQVRFALGKLLAEMLEFDAAEREIRIVLDRDPGNISVLVALSQVYQRMGRKDDAIETLERAIELCPGSYTSHVLLGGIRADMGLHADAIAHLERAIALDERSPEAYLMISHIKTNDENQLKVVSGYISKISGILEGVPRDDLKARMPFHFALGNLCDTLGDHDRSFANYLLANRIVESLAHPKFSVRTYCEQNTLRRRVFTRSLYDRFQPPEDEALGSRLIFIIGMPRTGTTLVEQILGCHPAVVAGGERPDVSKIIYEMFSIKRYRRSYPKNLDDLDDRDLRSLRRLHLERIAKLTAPGQYFTDKLPENYREIGLIRLLFPMARIIHCVRNPLDTCISIFFQEFDRLNYSNNLHTLFYVYDSYRNLMEHWNDVMGSTIKLVEYEKLVDDPEHVVRGILEYCGLAWEPKCLEFHRAPRTPFTASRWQVKMPIYTSSKLRWTRYKRHLSDIAIMMHNKSYITTEDKNRIIDA